MAQLDPPPKSCGTLHEEARNGNSPSRLEWSAFFAIEKGIQRSFSFLRGLSRVRFLPMLLIHVPFGLRVRMVVVEFVKCEICVKRHLRLTLAWIV